MRQLLSLIFLLGFSVLYAQTSIDKIQLHSEKIYGPDDILINGKTYVPDQPFAFGDPYFVDNNFTYTTIVAKGRTFENILCIYDIEKQTLVLKSDEASGSKIIALSDNYIKEFYLYKSHFINLQSRGISDNNIKFLELIYDGDFIFGIRYSKEFLAVFSNTFPKGRYTNTKYAQFLFLDGKKIEIENKRDLYQVFPEHKHDIKKFIKKNKIKFRKATKSELYKIMQYCDGFE